ncbi:DNA-3-methyladenine glycosylase I [Litoreibacter roseus]|uniref:DNA-3-methyladenine glycosylase I n=1 Tax=Litoreibacter roseus TaxID=2601869 RepID=A0A6N6JJQ3_9RHOB|nr:DNA-3-methyladenine glycosylase I [Litoreibacter roseus]GFE66364.1 DNA-3-methyladenine glycosylase I [Litoreibacter roseus]
MAGANMERCSWCGTEDIYVEYHDAEWGVPQRDSRMLWEMLVLEGFQAGLNWITILKKRENFREAFEGFDPDKIATWGEPQIEKLLQNPGIIRHRGKIAATITNAQAWQAAEQNGGFDRFIWDYVDHQPIQNDFQSMSNVPAATDLSTRMSKDLKKAGFKFCGPTIVYAFMQACGLVNDHMTNCPRHSEVARLSQ